MSCTWTAVVTPRFLIVAAARRASDRANVRGSEREYEHSDVLGVCVHACDTGVRSCVTRVEVADDKIERATRKTTVQ
jgi:hypothetical protein